MSSNNNNNSSDSTENNGAIIHVREDSNKSIDEMFAIALKPQGAQRPLSVPLRMRKFPTSFWNPPSSGSKSPNYHSRENSVDNTLQNPPSNLQADPFSPAGSTGSVGSPQPPTSSSAPFHSRAHSSPATLQQTLVLANNPPQTASLHHRTASFDPVDKLGSLPPGWEMAKDANGQMYFMNHITKTTQWEDPRKMMIQQQQQQQQPPPQQQQQQQQPPIQVQQGLGNGPSRGGPSPQPIHQRSNSASSVFNPSPQPPVIREALGQLPPGWEQSVTPEGQIYFIDHTTKNTTWLDPRIPPQNQITPTHTLHVDYQTQQRRQQDARLQKLVKERKALQQRQAELIREMEQQRQRSLSQENVAVAMNQTQEMLMRQTLGDSPSNGDPFLGNTSQIVHLSEQHNRQESADSGVGMGSSFNLISIPEVDMDMDTSSAMDTTLTPTNDNDGGASTTNGSNSMDSDQMIPVLPTELDEVVQDVLSNGQLVNGPQPTWL